jgi:hypothetical protein
MEASSQRTWQVRLSLMMMVGVAAAAACVVALMLWKAPVASAQDEGNDPTGANFVVSCGFSHRAQVDPIVNPGPSGTPSDHMHDFFGNRTTDSNSTLDNSTPPWTSLLAAASRTDHGTTCEPKPGQTFGDTAAYWHPTVTWTPNRGKPKTLQASQTFFYYRAGLKAPADVKPFPPGLKIVTIKGKKVEWRCQGGTFSPTPPTQCGDNNTLVVRIFFPDCLQQDANVPLLDSADHNSHMVEATSAGCPTGYLSVPRLQTNFLFKDTILTKKGHVTLSSDHLDEQGNPPPPGSTMHVDFFNAWQAGTLEDLVKRCINPGPFSATKPKPADCS